MTRKVKNNTYANGDLAKIGTNSAAFVWRAMVNDAGEFLALATAGSWIGGVAKETVTMASDNQTVAKRAVIFEPVKADTTFEIAITGGTITSSDEGKFYDLSTATVVDGATESATTGQLQLVRFKTATKCDFKIVNA